MQTHEPSRKAACNHSPVPAYAFLAPRPFAEPPKPEAVPPSTASGRLGISLARLNCSPLEPRLVLQPKLTIGKPGDQYEQEDCVPPVLQPKLTIGEPGDPYEQEADRVAADVVQRLHSPEALPIAPLSSGKGDEKPIQRSSAMTATVPTLQADFETQLNQARSGGAPLDNAFRAKIEPIMGADFSGVRVHTDAQADQLSRDIQAKAFTTKQDVFFRQGTYEPGSRGGQELIVHELTHVVQQDNAFQRREAKGERREHKVSESYEGKEQGGELDQRHKLYLGREIEASHFLVDREVIQRLAYANDQQQFQTAQGSIYIVNPDGLIRFKTADEEIHYRPGKNIMYAATQEDQNQYRDIANASEYVYVIRQQEAIRSYFGAGEQDTWLASEQEPGVENSAHAEVGRWPIDMNVDEFGSSMNNTGVHRGHQITEIYDEIFPEEEVFGVIEELVVNGEWVLN